MPAVPGRGADVGGRPLTLTLVTGSSTVTATGGGTFTGADIGKILRIAGQGVTGMHPSARILTVPTSTTATVGGGAATVSRAGVEASVVAVEDAGTQGFRGWSPETPAEAAAHGVPATAGVNDSARLNVATTSRRSTRRTRA